MSDDKIDSIAAVVVGGGPAGLMAAEALAEAGAASRSVRRHALGRAQVPARRQGRPEPHARRAAAGIHRNATARGRRRWRAGCESLSPTALRDWAAGLGIETFVGSSGRVFPQDLKAAPLLRAWLHRLRERGVVFHMRHRWLGWSRRPVRCASRHLAANGPSPRRRDRAGAGRRQLARAWAPTAPGCPGSPTRGVDCGAAAARQLRFRRRPGARICASASPASRSSRWRLRFDGRFERQGEFVLTDYGIEGSLVYAASGLLRDAIERDGRATLTLDLLPAFDAGACGARSRAPARLAQPVHAPEEPARPGRREGGAAARVAAARGAGRPVAAGRRDQGPAADRSRRRGRSTKRSAAPAA